MNFAAYSQDTTSKIWVPRADLRAALKRLEQGKVDSAALVLTMQENQLLLQRLTVKDSTISGMASLIENKDKQTAGLALQLKRQKKKTIGLGMLAFTLFASLIFIK